MFLDALVVRCVLLPAVLELLGPVAWYLPPALDSRLPRINIEGSSAAAEGQAADGRRDAIPEPIRASAES